MTLAFPIVVHCGSVGPDRQPGRRDNPSNRTIVVFLFSFSKAKPQLSDSQTLTRFPASLPRFPPACPGFDRLAMPCQIARGLRLRGFARLSYQASRCRLLGYGTAGNLAGAPRCRGKLCDIHCLKVRYKPYCSTAVQASTSAHLAYSGNRYVRSQTIHLLARHRERL